MFPSLRGVSWALGEKRLGFTFEVEVEAVLASGAGVEWEMGWQDKPTITVLNVTPKIRFQSLRPQYPARL